MGVLKILLSLIFIVVAVGLFALYWFMPFSEYQFEPIVNGGDTNFSIINNSDGSHQEQQFYDNMRFPTNQIAYQISGDCPLQKRNDMERAFAIIEGKTNIKFYESNQVDGIAMTCDSNEKIEGNLIISGEGGPTKIIRTKLFNVILTGKILLREESSCPKPNVAIHELFHALGFEHSDNPNNIMYNISRCNQEIGQDTIDLINKLYAIPSEPDLELENVSASIDGRYMETEFSVKNDGLKDAPAFNVLIYTDNSLVKTMEMELIDFGGGRRITLGNLWVSDSSPDTIRFVINSSFDELDKKNNEIVLQVKK